MAAEYILRALDHLNAQRGQALAEYTLILAFVLVMCAIALGGLGLIIAGHWASAASLFP